MEGAKLKSLKDERPFEEMWNLSWYKKGSPTHMIHYSFHFFKEGERERSYGFKRGVGEGGERFQASRTLILSKYYFPLLILSS